MATRTFALVIGIIYLIVGILGLIPGLLVPVSLPGVTVTSLEGAIFGIFPVNLIHTLIHLIIGIWGILAYRSFTASRSFSITIGVIFIILFILGLIPGANVLFGLAPLFGADVWLHLVTGILGLYFGLTARRGVDVYTDTNPPVPPAV